MVYDKKPFKMVLEAGKTYHWCLCGRSKSQPLCDGTHKDIYLKITQRLFGYLFITNTICNENWLIIAIFKQNHNFIFENLIVILLGWYEMCPPYNSCITHHIETICFLLLWLYMQHSRVVVGSILGRVAITRYGDKPITVMWFSDFETY